MSQPQARAAVLMSIRPRWAEALLARDKRAEFRTRYPLDAPRTVLVYAAAPVSAIVGELDVDRVDTGTPAELWDRHCAYAGLSRIEYDRYFAGRGQGARALLVGSARRYPSPVPLDRLGLLRPPQSWRYLHRAAVDRCG